MSGTDPDVLAALLELIDDTPRPMVLGICGAQGGGKSTLAAALSAELQAAGKICAVLSIDDLYLTKAQRNRLASQVHPLCKTRGPPGTHDVALGLEVLDMLRSGLPVKLPRFDKAQDDRAALAAWPLAPPHCDVVLFEGWCVGARPQADQALSPPVNELEAAEDVGGVWRRFANNALAGPYQDLFSRIDRLLLLAAPDFEVVQGWRLQQEDDLRKRTGNSGMDGPQIARFIAHYERITRHILAEMPGRADLVVRLDRDRQVLSMDRRK